MTKCGFLVLLSLLFPSVSLSAEDVVAFPSGKITLHGVLYRPAGTGPFPAVVYNHGSAAGMLSKQAFDALGPVFASHGTVASLRVPQRWSSC
jgi:carboxymethylenebutenolidase